VYARDRQVVSFRGVCCRRHHNAQPAAHGSPRTRLRGLPLTPPRTPASRPASPRHPPTPIATRNPKRSARTRVSARDETEPRLAAALRGVRRIARTAVGGSRQSTHGFRRPGSAAPSPHAAHGESSGTPRHSTHGRPQAPRARAAARRGTRGPCPGHPARGPDSAHQARPSPRGRRAGIPPGHVRGAPWPLVLAPPGCRRIARASFRAGPGRASGPGPRAACALSESGLGGLRSRGGGRALGCAARISGGRALGRAADTGGRDRGPCPAGPTDDAAPVLGARAAEQRAAAAPAAARAPARPRFIGRMRQAASERAGHLVRRAHARPALRRADAGRFRPGPGLGWLRPGPLVQRAGARSVARAQEADTPRRLALAPRWAGGPAGVSRPPGPG
jgi:hypothetical protein